MHRTALPPRHSILPNGDLVMTDAFGGRQIDARDWMWLGNAIILLDSRDRAWAEYWDRAYAAEPELDSIALVRTADPELDRVALTE